MQRKIFWLLLIVLGVLMDFTLPFLWSVILTVPLIAVCWWVAFRSGWFD